MAKRTALGKGLGAVLGENAAAFSAESMKPAAHPAAVAEIPLCAITPNPWQPRDHFSEEALADLAASIRSLGIIQPLTLRRTDNDTYQIISGERRYRAALAAGLESVPAYVREANDTEMVEMALVENLQREDLDPIETALAFQRLTEEFHLTQEALSQRIGKSRSTVANTLRLLTLPPEGQLALRRGAITPGHAKVLLGIEEAEEQRRLLEDILRYGWSVRRLEERIRETGRTADEPSGASFVPETFVQAVNLLGSFCDNRITVKRRGRDGGSVTLRFKDAAQLEQFLNILSIPI